MNILLPQPIHEHALELLQEAGMNVKLAPEASEAGVLPLLGECQAIILRTGIKLSSELLAKAPHLMVVARTGGGVDNVDVEAATRQGVIVTSNLGVNTISVVEHTLALMLALCKKLPLMDRSVRSAKFDIRYQNLPRDLNGRVLGLLGAGRIGSRLGVICHELLGMQVIAHDPAVSVVPGRGAEIIRMVGFEELFEKSDVVSVHVPLTPATRHLVGAREIALMKPDAILINTSRGGVVQEDALVEALKGKKLAGAGLDVFESEPVNAGNPLLERDDVILTPHSAALTRECVVRMAKEAAINVLRVFKGQRPLHIANPAVLEQERWRHLAVPENEN